MRAPVQHPCGLAIVDWKWKGSIPAGGQRLRARRDLPRESVPRTFSQAWAAVQPGLPPRRAQDPHHPPSPASLSLAQAQSEDLASVCGRSAPRLVQLFLLGDPGMGGGDAAWAPRLGVGGRRQDCRPVPWTSGNTPHRLAPTCPGVHVGAGTFLEGASFRSVWGTDQKPLSLPREVGFGNSVKGKPTVLPASAFSPGMQELCGTLHPCLWLESLFVHCALQALLSRLLVLRIHTG